MPFVIAAWFGATAETDVLFFAYALALFVSNVLAPVLENLSVPFIAERRGRGQSESSFVTSLALVALVGAAATSALLAAASLPLLPHVTAFPPESLTLASRLLLQVTPLVALTALSSVFSGALNSTGRFYLTASSPFIRAAVNLLMIWLLHSSLGVSAVIVGYVVGEASRALVLLVACVRSHLLSLDGRPADVRRDVTEFLRVAAYQSLGMVSIGLVPLVDRTMASWLGHGSVSLLEYSERLYQIPLAIMGTGVVVTSLSRWSAILYTKGSAPLAADVRRVVAAVLRIGLVLSMAFAAASPLIVDAVYGSSLSYEENHLVLATLLAYLLGVTPFVVGQLHNRALLALKQTRFLLSVTLLANCLNVALNLLMMRALGLAGLALSSSTTALLVAFVLKRRFASATAGATISPSRDAARREAASA
ncbi:MAG: hypothetical protein IBX63_10260 [Coriobacteriia bacterium]|nr:hypothetical protein [Coriobacteriia bacterium]